MKYPEIWRSLRLKTELSISHIKLKSFESPSCRTWGRKTFSTQCKRASYEKTCFTTQCKRALKSISYQCKHGLVRPRILERFLLLRFLLIEKNLGMGAKKVGRFPRDRAQREFRVIRGLPAHLERQIKEDHHIVTESFGGWKVKIWKENKESGWLDFSCDTVNPVSLKI